MSAGTSGSLRNKECSSLLHKPFWCTAITVTPHTIGSVLLHRDFSDYTCFTATELRCCVTLPLGINGVTFWLSRVVLAANWKLIAEPSEIGPGNGLAFCWTVIMVPNCSLKLKGLSPKILALSAGK